MTGPRPISSRESALRAEHEAESLPHTTLRIRVPRHADEVGALPRRRHTFVPPLLGLAGLSRDGSETVRPAGARGYAPRIHSGSVAAPEGIHRFHPETPADRAAIRRTGRELLRARPGSEPRISSTIAPTSAVVESPPSLTDCRRDLSAFRNAMSEFTRARYFGGEDRHVEAAAALSRAEEAYSRLYANLPLTPGMSSVLENLDNRMRESRETLAAITPAPTHRSRRRHA